MEPDSDISSPIYLDHCGTTPLSDYARRAMVDFLGQTDLFGNPAAHHHLIGRRAFEVVETCREKISQNFGVKAEDVVFTGTASEANNLVIQGFLQRNRGRKPRLLVGATEHKSMLEPCLHVSSWSDAEVVVLPVHPHSGEIDLRRLDQELELGRQKPTLVALMLCNNEIPARHPVEEIGRLCSAHKASFHCDGVQGIVREKVDLKKFGCSSFVWTPHKIYGPKGLGVLILNPEVKALRLLPLCRGGDQEQGLRPGTLNTLAIVGAAAALEEHEGRRSLLLSHMKICEKIFIDSLAKADIGFHLTVQPNKSCPGIVNFYLENIEAQSFLEACAPVCVNRGASCTGAGGERFSHVPQALGLPLEIATNVLRASFGFGASVSEVERAACILVATALQLRP